MDNLEVVRIKGRIAALENKTLVQGWLSIVGENLQPSGLFKTLISREYKAFERAYTQKRASMVKKGTAQTVEVDDRQMPVIPEKLTREHFAGQSSSVPVVKPQRPVPKKLDTQEFLREQARGAKGDVR